MFTYVGFTFFKLENQLISKKKFGLGPLSWNSCVNWYKYIIWYNYVSIPLRDWKPSTKRENFHVILFLYKNTLLVKNNVVTHCESIEITSLYRSSELKNTESWPIQHFLESELG